MTGWRAPIIQHFGAANAAAGRLSVVSDPDGMLTEPDIVERLAADGFEILTFGDPVAFRYSYEIRFRQHWDRGEASHLVVVLRTHDGDLKCIPYDLLDEAQASGRVLKFSLVDSFPGLAPNVVAELDRQHYDLLNDAVQTADPGKLGSQATRDFILRYVFELAPEIIRAPAELLRVLLRRHYRTQVLPPSFDQRIAEILSQTPSLQAWPILSLLRSKEMFLSFLSERWPHFLLAQGLASVPGQEPPPTAIPGPQELPFDHDDVRVYMDNFFVEGLLPTTQSVGPISDVRWFAVGITGSPQSSSESRFLHLLDELSNSVPSAEKALFQDWQEFALRWGTLTHLRYQCQPQLLYDEEGSISTFVDRVQAAFSTWLLRRFGSLASLPYLPRPVMGHHIPHYFAHHLGRPGLERIALLVIDGMAIDQWRILKETCSSFELEEHALFSWIPTLTQVARQAIFSGRTPLEFATSIEGTYREPQHWSNFWNEQGLHSKAVRYVKPQGKKESFEPLAKEILAAADDSKVRVIGAVVSIIDQNIHQIGLGTPGIHALVEVWAKSRQLATLVSGLLHRGFAVFITADHGNTFGRGFGKPNVGVTAQQRGERAHIFRNKGFRDSTAPLYPNSIEWPPIGLPEDYFPLIAPYGACFLDEGKEAVSHGGIALEEVMVPWVRVSERR